MGKERKKKSGVEPEAEGPVATREDGVSGRSSRMFHPATGALVLGVDWLLFSGNVLSGGLALPAAMAMGFALGGVGTGLVQRFAAGDGVGRSVAKALAAGVIVGMPTPVAGTALGGTILALSGLSSWFPARSSGKS